MTTATSRRLILTWACLLGGVIALTASSRFNGAPYITNDGYQYLDAASHLASGHCFCTDVALFDEQVAFGHMPVPFTHFAPGYPLLIAAISLTGIPGAMAGYLISAAGFLAVIWLIWDLSLSLGASVPVTTGFCFLWITHATALYYASAVGTESLFTCLLLALLALIVRDVLSGRNRAGLSIAIGLVAGLSYWVRYPGLFLVAGAGFYLVFSLWKIPHARRPAFAGLLIAAALVGSIQIRNLIYTGSWRGGFKETSLRSPLKALAETGRAFIHLLTGDRIPLRLGWGSALLIASVLGFLALALRNFVPRDPAKSAPRKAAGWAVLVIACYAGGVFVASITTIASDLPRYYFPVYPFLLAGFAVAGSGTPKGLRFIAAACVVISAVAVQTPNTFVPPPVPDWIVTRTALAAEVQPNITLLRWLRDRTNSRDVVVAIEGQALHYILDRPVVAVIAPEDSSRSASEAGYHSLMRQFGSRYLLVYPGLPAAKVPEQAATPFLRDLAAGASPSWLDPAAHTHDAAVYECRDCLR